MKSSRRGHNLLRIETKYDTDLLLNSFLKKLSFFISQFESGVTLPFIQFQEMTCLRYEAVEWFIVKSRLNSEILI